MDYSSYEHLVVEIDDGVAVVRMNRPERLNAFNILMAEEMLRIPGELREDPDVRCVILTGTGRGFCTGLDIKEVTNASETIFGQIPMDEIGISGRFTLAWHEIDKPTIAAVNGVAAGGGLGFALMQDIRIVCDSTRLLPMFTRRGVAPEVGVSWTAVHAVGLQRALAWYYTDRELSGREALEWGVALELVPDDQLMATAMTLAKQIAAGPPLTVRLVRRALYHAEQFPELRQHLSYAWRNVGTSTRTADIKEAGAALAERREPQFVGR
jgi:enoyl-CoA hydratase/carnithine racemase